MSDAFERWIRSNRPAAPDDPDEARYLWSRIEDRIHERRQRRITRGTGLAAVAVVVLVLGIVDVAPLGGNSWNLIESNRREGVVEDPLTGHLYTTEIGFDEGMDGDITARAFWETVREQRAAGNYTLEAIDFYQYGDDIEFNLATGHRIGSRFKTATRPVKGGGDIPHEVTKWMAPYIIAFVTGDDAANWHEVESRRYVIDGNAYWFRVWMRDTERGPIYHGIAVIPGKPQSESPGVSR